MVDLVGKKVKHTLAGGIFKAKNLGSGTITEQSESSVTVKFGSGKKEFGYPDAFKNILTLEEEELQTAVLDEIRKKAEAQDTRKAEQIKKLQEEMAAQVVAKTKKTNKYMPADRTDSNPRTYYVFQNKTYEKERDGQFVAASAKSTSHSMVRLEEMRPGDVVFHGVSQKIKAISLVNSPVEFCNYPGEEGDLCRLVRLEYHELKKPVAISEFKDYLATFSEIKYSPFGKTGKGTQGYMYPLERELAVFFLSKLSDEDQELKNLGFLQFLQ